MMQEHINKVSNEMNKKKDIWFLETLEKHGLIKTNDLTNMDLYWLSAEMGVKVTQTEDQKTQIYIGSNLIGEWHNAYEFVKDDEGNFNTVTKYWN